MKKTSVVVAGLLLFAILVLPGCASGANGTQATNPPGSTGTDTEVVMTLEELSQFNGKDGNRAYVAVDGVIYDVTDLPRWKDGEHNGYSAGQDLTDIIKNKSPHGVSKLRGVPVVGKLQD